MELTYGQVDREKEMTCIMHEDEKENPNSRWAIWLPIMVATIVPGIWFFIFFFMILN